MISKNFHRKYLLSGIMLSNLSPLFFFLLYIQIIDI
jgi:membrane glycosyltransferase